jgi:hypothetical protein
MPLRAMLQLKGSLSERMAKERQDRYGEVHKNFAAQNA